MNLRSVAALMAAFGKEAESGFMYLRRHVIESIAVIGAVNGDG